VAATPVATIMIMVRINNFLSSFFLYSSTTSTSTSSTTTNTTNGPVSRAGLCVSKGGARALRRRLATGRSRLFVEFSALQLRELLL